MDFPELDAFYAQQQALDEQELRIREQRRALKQATAASINEIVARTPPGQHEEVICCLYWQHRTIPVAAIAQGFGIEEKDVLRLAQGNGYVVLTCRTCGNTFRDRVSSRSSYTPNQKSAECAICELQRNEAIKVQRQQHQDRITDLATMPYRAYLQTPEWAAQRKSALRRARFACQLCDAKTTLHVHHRTYERRGNEEPRDLIVLCAPCHAKFHDKLANLEVAYD